MRRSASLVFDTKGSEKQPGVSLGGLSLGLGEDIRHHIPAHCVREDRAHQHCRRRFRVELLGDPSLALERHEVVTQIAGRAPRNKTGALAHLRSLLDLAHRLTDYRAAKSQV